MKYNVNLRLIGSLIVYATIVILLLVVCPILAAIRDAAARGKDAQRNAEPALVASENTEAAMA